MTGAFPVVVAGIFGACIGSFCNVVVWRLPRGESVAKGRSHCPRCGHLIRWHDNVPVLAWLMLRGRCRDCRAPISARYPFVEALTAALFVLSALAFPWPAALGPQVVVSLVLAALVCVAFVDIDRREIPDAITKPGIAVGLLCALLVPEMHSATFLTELANRRLAAVLEGAAGAATGALVLLVVRWVGHAVAGKEAMGLGDVKLLAMVGAFSGPVETLLVLLVASVAGSVLGGVYVASRARRLAPLTGTLALGDAAPASFSRARVRAPRRAPVTVAVPVAPSGAGAAPTAGTKARLDLVLPGAAVWSDDGKDVRVSVRGVVEGVERHREGTLVVVRPEPLPEADEEWLATFALQRLSIPFGVFLALGAAAVLLAGDDIARFVTQTWPRFVTGR
ncbi:MAG: prepilin peptidase [Planctomycetes bacterium]|nr:prepilin peptidase [Planctomycetota bacterium]